MNPRARKRITKGFCYVSALYICIWAIRSLSNEGEPTAMRHSKAISPSRYNSKELRDAIFDCKSENMYELAPSKCTGKPLVLLIVISSPNSIFKRHMLRKYLTPNGTLQSYEGPAWKLVFVISRTNNPFLETKIQEEITAKQDIILGR